MTPLVDFAIAFVLLLGMMAWFGIMPTWGILILPLFMLFALLTALAVSLLLAPLNVRYRDVGHAIPFLIQFWMYASPVAYSVNLIPEQWRPLYSLNPMLGVIEGFRWALLGKASPDFEVMVISAAAVLVLLVGRTGLLQAYGTYFCGCDLMSDIAIRAEHLSKQYKIGVGKHHNTLRDQLVYGVKSLFRRNGCPHAGKETFWALQDVSFEIMRGRKCRDHRAQWRWQKHLAQDSLAHHGADQGPSRDIRTARLATGGRHWLQSRIDRAGKSLPQRCHPGHAEGGD